MERLIKDYEQLANKYSHQEVSLERKIKENEAILYDCDILRKQLKDMEAKVSLYISYEKERKEHNSENNNNVGKIVRSSQNDNSIVVNHSTDVNKLKDQIRVR
jgi:hypothetical protein